MSYRITNENGVITSLEIIMRIDDLRTEIEPSEADRAELRTLIAFRDEYAVDFEGWEFGLEFINADYFEEYAKELARGVYGVDYDSWPFTHIDWKAAALELENDYETVAFDGCYYYVNP
jgi:hypothetical protein